MSQPTDAAPAPPQFTVTGERIIKSGWLYREESVQGSLTTWKKRWNTVTLQSFQSFKNNSATDSISSLHVSQIEEMAYGATVGDKTRTFAFSLTTPRGMVRLAAETEEERKNWVSVLRELVPKAKIELAKEMLIRKAKRKANLELAQQQIKEAIESILRDSKRVAVRGGFKTYADALAETYQGLLRTVDAVGQFGLNSPKHCAYSISSVVDAANSAAAICKNRAIQDEIVVRTRDIAVDCAALLGFSITAPNDANAKQDMYDTIQSIQEQIQELLQLLAAAGELQQELDDAKHEIERAVESPATSLPTQMNEQNVQACIDSLSDRANVLSTTIKNIAHNACITPERVGEYSKEAAELMCEILDATNIVAVYNGVDLNDPDYLAGANDISPAKRMQIESLLAAAKGFAAATTNMIDLLREVPQQEDDENIQFRLSQATRSADSALSAFMSSTINVQSKEFTQGYDADYESFDQGPQINADDELLKALNAIESHCSRFSSIDVAVGSSGAYGQANSRNGPVGSAAQLKQQSIAQAARNICQATATLMGKTKAAHAHIKESDPEGYRRDPNWAAGLVAAAQAVAETTGQLCEVGNDVNANPADVVAAARCVDDASIRLAAFTRAKADPNGPHQTAVEDAIRGLTKATNALIDATLVQSDEKQNEEDDSLEAIRRADKSKQMKLEFEAQAIIAKLESELDAARQYLFKYRRTLYGV